MAKGVVTAVCCDQTRAAGVHANDFFVFGPDGHHGLYIAAFERLVKGGLDILRAGENFLVGHGQRADFAVMVAATCCGVIPFRQSKCPSGHSRAKQGLHGRFLETIIEFDDNGGVYAGEDEP